VKRGFSSSKYKDENEIRKAKLEIKKATKLAAFSFCVEIPFALKFYFNDFGKLHRSEDQPLRNSNAQR